MSASDKRPLAIAPAAEAPASTAPSAMPLRAAKREATLGDGVDLRFLDLLSDLGGTRLTRSALATLTVNDPPSASGKSPNAQSKTSADATANVATPSATPPANTPLASRDAEAGSAASTQRELSALSDDLTRTDLRVLDQWAIAAMGLPGGVPMQQLFALNAQGKPEFSRAGLSERFAHLMEKAYSENRSVRVELDSRSSLILRFSGGQVSAEFLTQDQAMAHTLRQTLDALRQRLAERQLPVSGLTYRQGDPQRSPERDPDDAPPSAES